MKYIALLAVVLALVALATADPRVISTIERDSFIESSWRVNSLTTAPISGVPRVVFGHLGFLPSSNELAFEPESDVFISDSRYSTEAIQWLKDNGAAWQLSGVEDFFPIRVERNDLGVHVHIDQTLRGLRVVGGDCIVHINPRTAAVEAVTGAPISATAEHEPHVYTNIVIAPADALAMALIEAGLEDYKIDETSIEEVIVQHLDTYTGHHAHYAMAYSKGKSPVELFADSNTGRLIMAPTVWRGALDRTVWNTFHTTLLPGAQITRTETSGPSPDLFTNEAFDNIGICYDYYMNVFGRDSWDGRGSPLNSTVHYDKLYDNAFWNGNQMVYGDGDNVSFYDFTQDTSVICHELTHGVTQATAGLIYWNEPGALNEAHSDIMGATAVIYHNDPVNMNINPSKDWLIGEKVYLDGVALRYMDNPVLDGYSADYYPDRITSLPDNKGVHGNSGIANLAYVLLVQGGVHPQQKTTNYVAPAGVHVAQQVYYTVLSSYLTSTSNFADVKSMQVQVSGQMFGSSVQKDVQSSWEAVGV